MGSTALSLRFPIIHLHIINPLFIFHATTHMKAVTSNVSHLSLFGVLFLISLVSWKDNFQDIFHLTFFWLILLLWSPLTKIETAEKLAVKTITKPLGTNFRHWMYIVACIWIVYVGKVLKATKENKKKGAHTAMSKEAKCKRKILRLKAV